MQYPLTAIAILLVVLAGCSDAERAQRGAPESLPLHGNDEIEALIEQLVIAPEPAEDAPVYTPSEDTPDTDPRVIAHKAVCKLERYGRAAFPSLVAHLADDRQSICLRRMIPCNVGLVCFSIIENQIVLLPEDYTPSLVREGTDGEFHLRPRFSAPGPFSPKTLPAWLAEREQRSLTEMQVDAMEKLIEQESAIGFPTESDRQCFLYPLERQVARLKAQIAGSQPARD